MLMKNFDFKDFKDKLKVVTEEIYASLDKSNLIGFSLFTDSDAGSISYAYNTVAYLENQCKENPDQPREYYKWYPPEWAMEGESHEKLNNLSAQLFKLEFDAAYFEEFKAQLFNTIAESLKELKEEGQLFSNASKDLVLVFSIMDHYDYESDLNWVKLLNEEEQFAEYKAYMDQFQ